MDHFRTLSQIGAVFGLSGRKIGALLTQWGVRTANRPHPDVLANRHAKRVEMVTGQGFYVWDLLFVSNLLRQHGHHPQAIPTPSAQACAEQVIRRFRPCAQSAVVNRLNRRFAITSFCAFAHTNTAEEVQAVLALVGKQMGEETVGVLSRSLK